VRLLMMADYLKFFTQRPQVEAAISKGSHELPNNHQ